MANSFARSNADNFFLVSCEHGGNQVPQEYAGYFAASGDLLASHRGYDPGALQLAEELAAALGAPLFPAVVSRLVVDLNRSPGHPGLYGPALRQAPKAIREEIVERHYLPHRQRIESLAEEQVRAGKTVIHLASHSFTPVLDNRIRHADIGLLYDPERPAETALCACWSACLKSGWPQWRIRRNYPYAGRTDGLCTYLRRRLSKERYVGIELEINQKYALADGEIWNELRRAVIDSFLAVTTDH